MGKMTPRDLGERGGCGLRGCRASCWETTARVSHWQTLVEGLSRSQPRCWGQPPPTRSLSGVTRRTFVPLSLLVTHTHRDTHVQHHDARVDREEDHSGRVTTCKLRAR